MGRTWTAVGDGRPREIWGDDEFLPTDALAERMLWWALGEVLAHEDFSPMVVGSGRKVLLYNRPLLGEDALKAKRVSEIARRIQHPEPTYSDFTPAIRDLSGRVSQLTGMEPEAASINLLRHADDEVVMHADGPAVFEPRFATVSLGAWATLRLEHMRSERPPYERPVPPGSLYVLDGDDMQRNWLHGARLRSSEGRPRLSVTFLRFRAEAPDDSWILSDGNTERCVAIGTLRDMTETAQQRAMDDPFIAGPSLRRSDRAEKEALGLPRREDEWDDAQRERWYGRPSRADEARLARRWEEEHEP